MRTIIDLPENQIKALQTIGLQEEKSRAALIREAVEQYLVNRPPSQKEQKLAALNAAFGCWEADANFDSVAYVNALRDEWER